jgi:hypothetical protein
VVSIRTEDETLELIEDDELKLSALEIDELLLLLAEEDEEDEEEELWLEEIEAVIWPTELLSIDDAEDETEELDDDDTDDE